jgi:hypothetical protein
MHLPDEDEAWEVRVFNLSRFGAGFISTEPLQLGTEMRLRIGRGPIRRARLIRIVACRESDAGTYAVGAEFIDIPSKELAKAS